MHDLETINEALDNLAKTERARVLYELLSETIGVDPQSKTPFTDIQTNLKILITKEKEAIKIMADTQLIIDKKPTEEETAVS